MDYIDLGRRVREMRKQQKMTQEELAAKVNISASFLGHVERGSRVASLETLVALCEALHAEPNYLLAGSISPWMKCVPVSASDEVRKKMVALFEQAAMIVGE